jgi:selenocysteine lyase/cysteine desulfurase
MSLASKGVELRFIPCVDGLPDERLLMDSLDDRRVRAVAVSWVGFASGYRVNLEVLGRECRSRGIFLAVDGIQGLGALELDLGHLNVDIFANGCQKWLLSPWGTGFVYVRRELITTLTPVNVGWLAFKGSEDFNNLTRYDAALRDDARRFEVGTHGLQDFAALNASVSLFLELGPRAVAAHIARLASIASEWAATCSGLTLLSPSDADQRAGIVSIGMDNAAAVADYLRSRQVAFSLREGAIRIAVHLFNTESELRRVFGLIEDRL